MRRFFAPLSCTLLFAFCCAGFIADAQATTDGFATVSFTPATISAHGGTTTLYFFGGDENHARSSSFRMRMPVGLAAPVDGSGNIIYTASGCSSSAMASSVGGTGTLTFQGSMTGTTGGCGFKVVLTATQAFNYDSANDSLWTITAGGVFYHPQATLRAVANAPTATFAFAPSSIPFHGMSNATLTIANADPDYALSGFALTLPLPSGLQVVTSSNGCGGTDSAAPGGAALGFSGSSLAVGASCTYSAIVQGIGAGTQNASAQIAANEIQTLAKTASLDVSQVAQTIDFPAQGAQTYSANGTFAIAPPATASSGLAVTYGSLTPLLCTVSGTAVTMLGAGACTLTADQAGDANYAVAPQATQTVTIGRASQTIAFGAMPSVTVGGSGTLSAAGGASGNLVTFGTASAASICKVSAGGNVVGVGVGTCIVIANQAGNADYFAAPQATQTITIGQGSQAITFGVAPSVTVGNSGTVSATGGASGNPVVFGTTSVASICTVSTSGSVAGVGAGACIVTANQAGDTNYTAAPQATQTVTIGQAVGALALASDKSTVVYGETFTLTATLATANPAPGGTVSFSNDGNAIAECAAVTAVGKTARCTPSGLAVGSHAISAAYSGDANTAPANAALTQTIAVAATTLTLSANPTPPVWTQPVTITVTAAAAPPGAGAPTGTITVGDGAETCTIALPATSCTLTPSVHGNVVLTASYPGDGNFAAATQSATLDVETAHLSAVLACTPTQPAPGVNVSCQATCTNAGPAPALAVRCDLTTANASSSGAGTNASARAVAYAAAAAVNCMPTIPVASLAAGASIVCTTSFVNAGTTVSASASANNAIAGPDSTASITFASANPGMVVPAPALRPAALLTLILGFACMATASLRRRRPAR